MEEHKAANFAGVSNPTSTKLRQQKTKNSPKNCATGAHRTDTNESTPGAMPQPGIHNAHKTIRQKHKDKWWQTKEAPTQSLLQKATQNTTEEQNFFCVEGEGAVPQ